MTAPVDLRSDTVTLPSAGMRKAMTRAKVGDSQRGEDPSVRALEQYAASLFGKEEALFVPSGTMGNLISVASWTRPGDIIVASESSHVAGREGPGISNLAAVAILGIDTPGGIFTAADVAGAIKEAPLRNRAKVRLVTAENTHNAGGGTIFPIASLRRIHSLCRKAGIPVHIDGSRIFNASVASGVTPADYGKACNSLMFCLSKGLGAPVGSIVVGSRDFLEEARSVGLRIGGGMRQAGIVAAGGLYALRNNVRRLAEDHENAKALARSLADLPGIEVINAPVETNIVLFRWRMPTVSLPEFQETSRERGVLLDDRSFPLFRAVTHLGIGKKEIARAVRAFRQVFGRAAA
ncbi:MAG: aminotransferase class I/II-fold pyridoxal phosphate-dependent enzyme [Deltaproteobacteria bacterium]|nr:aminotransferase class I/II-fold pyridoxal phosphate-dependent enzyme [Deltaproteobacteria bacterium]